jgi:CBS domain-containing protein
MLISEVMTHDVEFIGPDETLQNAALKMKELGVGTLPVCENAGVVGMLTDRDITVRAVADGQSPQTTHVRDVMSHELICCYEDQEVDVAAYLMRSQQIRRIVVVDRDKRLVGIVSLSDLALESASPEQAGEILQDVCAGASQV